MNQTTPEIEHAKSAGLRYVDDSVPGIRRKRTRTGFAYLDPNGKAIADETELARIRSLAIPPAYEDVWICPAPNGHVQATARDAKGRKQYRYHKRWREVRDANKYSETIAFAQALPALRERVARDLAKNDMSRENILATVVRMLEETLVRIGNESYAQANESFGLTTLRTRHVRVEGEKRIRLRFKGKSGVEHLVTIEDRRLARTIKRCRDLPGEVLFSYLDDAGEAHPVSSEDVNAYVREAMGGDFTAKDFRTWNATVICACALERAEPVTSQAQVKQQLTVAVTETARKLGNTAAVCRKSYVHPAVIETYLDELSLALPRTRARDTPNGLSTEELRVLAFLKAHAKRDAGATRLKLLERSVAAARRKPARSLRASA